MSSFAKTAKEKPPKQNIPFTKAYLFQIYYFNVNFTVFHPATSFYFTVQITKLLSCAHIYSTYYNKD